MPLANILDPVHDTLDPRVFDAPESHNPQLKQQHQDWIEREIHFWLTEMGYTHMEDWLSLVFTGSLTTYQYSDQSDVDISLFVDTEVFPEWSRAEMIGVMVNHVDGQKLPGTPFPLQCFVVPPEIKREDLYKPGLRSGWDFETRSWIVPPEKERVHDVEKEMNTAYVMGLEAADKMEHLLRYEPDKAVMYWHQIHKRRQRDQRAGKGDYSDSNIVYKFLANRGLFPQISEVSGEYIAKVAQRQYTGPRMFVVDKVAVRRAAAELGLTKPVEVIQIEGASGAYWQEPERHLIGVVGWLKPLAASRQIWHELRHAYQAESGTTFPERGDIPYEEYRNTETEQDAHSFAEGMDEFLLTHDVKAAGRLSMPYQPKRDAQWHLGLCGEYALALKERFPHLKMGWWGYPYNEDDFTGVDINHVFAHDDNFVYDVFGKHPRATYESPEAGRVDPRAKVFYDQDPEYLRDIWPIENEIVDEAHERIHQHSDPSELPARQAAWPVVRKFVYDADTDRLMIGELGPEEGSTLSHNQLCEKLGLEGLHKLIGAAGTINQKGWVQFEFQREQPSQNPAQVRHMAEQALRREIPDLEGFLGGETSDTLKELWQFSAVPATTPKQESYA